MKKLSVNEMKIPCMIGLIIIISLSLMLIFNWYDNLSQLDRLNIFEDANIDENDEYFRIDILVNGEIYYQTENVSWNWLIENEWIVNGEMRENNRLETPKFIEQWLKKEDRWDDNLYGEEFKVYLLAFY